MDRFKEYFKCYDAKFMRWVWAGLAVFAVTTVIGIKLGRGSPARYACAAIQAACMGALILSIVLRTRHLDELQRKIQFESIALAFTLGAAVITGWGYFEQSGAPHADWGLFIWPFYMVLWFTSLAAIRRRYR